MFKSKTNVSLLQIQGKILCFTKYFGIEITKLKYYWLKDKIQDIDLIISRTG